MAEKVTLNTDLILINELDALSTRVSSSGALTATDLILIQDSVKSYKHQYSNFVSGLVDNATLEVNNLKLRIKPSKFESIYPVGSIYMNASNSANPATLFGFGTWVAFGQGRVLIGAGSGTDDNAEVKAFTAGATGGEYNHTLTEAELAEHDHSLGENSRVQLGFDNGSAYSGKLFSGSFGNITYSTENAGGDQPHNNIQPYIVVYMWRRTA